MPLKLLRSIIQSGNDAVSGFYEKRVAEGVKNLREDVERRVEGLWKRDDKKDDAAGAPAAEAKPTEPTGDVKAGVLQEFVTHTAEAVETWQKRVDERVRDALSRVQREKAEKAEKEPASTGARPDRQAEIDALRARVAELEKKLSLLEGPKKA